MLAKVCSGHVFPTVIHWVQDPPCGLGRRRNIGLLPELRRATHFLGFWLANGGLDYTSHHIKKKERERERTSERERERASESEQVCVIVCVSQ